MSRSEYEALAAFRHTIGGFLAFSKGAARAAGLTPRQHQALLAVKGAPGGRRVTIGDLAQRLFIRHHSAVGLVDRLASSGFLARETAADDRRRVHLVLTPRGSRTLERLAAAHREELRQIRLPLQDVLDRLHAGPLGPTLTARRRRRSG